MLQQAGERAAGVSEPSVDRVGHGFDVHDEAGCGGDGVGIGDPLDERQLGGTIDRDDQVKLALLGTDLANREVATADRIMGETLVCRRERVRCGQHARVHDLRPPWRLSRRLAACSSLLT